MAHIKELWSQVRPQLKRDLAQAEFVDTKSGEKERGRKAAWALYNADPEKPCSPLFPGKWSCNFRLAATPANHNTCRLCPAHGAFMISPTPADLAQLAVNAATVLAGVLGTIAAAVKFVAWWKDRRLQARMESAKALASRELDDGLKAWGQQQLDRIHFACLSGIDRYDGYKALLACHQELGGTDSAWSSLRGVGPHLRCRKGFAWVRKLRRKDYMILAFSLVVFGMAATATTTLLAMSVTFGYAWFASGVILERLISLLLLGYGIAVCAMLAYGSAGIGNRYGNALQLRRRLFRIRAPSRACRALRTDPRPTWPTTTAAMCNTPTAAARSCSPSAAA